MSIPQHHMLLLLENLLFQHNLNTIIFQTVLKQRILPRCHHLQLFQGTKNLFQIDTVSDIWIKAKMADPTRIFMCREGLVQEPRVKYENHFL